LLQQNPRKRPLPHPAVSHVFYRSGFRQCLRMTFGACCNSCGIDCGREMRLLGGRPRRTKVRICRRSAGSGQRLKAFCVAPEYRRRFTPSAETAHANPCRINKAAGDFCVVMVATSTWRPTATPPVPRAGTPSRPTPPPTHPNPLHPAHRESSPRTGLPGSDPPPSGKL